MKRRLSFAAGALLVLGLAANANAHNKYKLVTPSAPVDDVFLANGGWEEGTRDFLGDSHHVLGGGSYFYKFHLDAPALVSVRFETRSVTVGATTYAAGLDPAFSVYKGLLGLLSHDETSYDPLNPVDELTFLSAKSRTDAAPDDPGIAYCIDDGTGTLIENPSWTVPQPGLGGKTPAQWYADTYVPHNGYRDTLNFTSTGGLYPPGTIDLDGSISGSAGSDVSCWVKHPYAGQFDALGDWSMANSYAVIGSPVIPSGCPLADCPAGNPSGDWSRLVYVGHANGNASSGGVRNTSAEVLADQLLDAGDYTIVAADGCDPCTSGGFFGGRVSISIVSSDLVATRNLVLKTNVKSAAKSVMMLSAKDPGITLGDGNGSGDDPRQAGGSLRVRSASAGFDATYPLPAAHWGLIGKAGQNKGYKYKDNKLTSGPIVSANITRTKTITLTGKGAGLGHVLAANHSPVDITLTVGAHRYCFRAGGEVKYKVSKTGVTYTAKNAAAPVECAP